MELLPSCGHLGHHCDVLHFPLLSSNIWAGWLADSFFFFLSQNYFPHFVLFCFLFSFFSFCSNSLVYFIVHLFLCPSVRFLSLSLSLSLSVSQENSKENRTSTINIQSSYLNPIPFVIHLKEWCREATKMAWCVGRLSSNWIIPCDCRVNSWVMDAVSLQWESESLISCTCSIFINVRNSGLSIALALSSLASDPTWHKQGRLNARGGYTPAKNSWNAASLGLCVTTSANRMCDIRTQCTDSRLIFIIVR